jgi:hypothetical protein
MTWIGTVLSFPFRMSSGDKGIYILGMQKKKKVSVQLHASTVSNPLYIVLDAGWNVDQSRGGSDEII